MGLARMNIWMSDVANPCGTFKGGGRMTILDCDGVLEWPCGRFMTPDGKWAPVPNGAYHDLPFRCGHLEVELPPGCYWVVAGYVGPPTPAGVHFNGTTHVGIVEVGCDETACVKLFNPTVRLCWDWFHAGLKIMAAAGGKQGITARQLKQIEEVTGPVLREMPTLPIEETVEKVFEGLLASAKKKR